MCGHTQVRQATYCTTAMDTKPRKSYYMRYDTPMIAGARMPASKCILRSVCCSTYRHRTKPFKRGHAVAVQAQRHKHRESRAVHFEQGPNPLVHQVQTQHLPLPLVITMMSICRHAPLEVAPGDVFFIFAEVEGAAAAAFWQKRVCDEVGVTPAQRQRHFFFQPPHLP